MTDTMNEAQYMTERVEDQIAWHDRQARRARRWHFGLTVATMALSASGALFTRFPALADVAAAASVLALIGGSLSSIGQYQARWVEYRAIAEGLRSERILYLMRCGPYADQDVNLTAIFVGRVEAVLTQGLGEWRQRAARTPEKGGAST